MEVEALIEAVRKRQALYDKGDDDYTNRGLINQKWREVAEEVGTDEVTARKKWAVLRDSFRRHYKKETTFKPEAGGKSIKKWYLYNNLLFLIPFVGDRSISTTSNLGEENEHELHDPSFHIEMLDDNLSSTSPGRPNSAPFEESQFSPSCTQTATTQPPIPTPLPKKKRPYPKERQNQQGSDSNSNSNSMSLFDVEMLNALNGLQQQRKTTPDADKQFLLSLLPVMKSLDPVSKFEFRGELNAVALSYLRRSQQLFQYGDQEHPSRASTPCYQQSPISLSTTEEDSCSKHDQSTSDASAQVHQSATQQDDS